MREQRKNTGGVGGRTEENELMFKEGYCGNQWIACWRPCRVHCLRIVQRNSQQSGVDFSNPLFSLVFHSASKVLLSPRISLHSVTDKRTHSLFCSYNHATSQISISTKKTKNKKWTCHSLTSYGVILYVKPCTEQNQHPCFILSPKMCFNLF